MDFIKIITAPGIIEDKFNKNIFFKKNSLRYLPWQPLPLLNHHLDITITVHNNSEAVFQLEEAHSAVAVLSEVA
jgi:hypothetical protein